jgi:hypothetical protein
MALLTRTCALRTRTCLEVLLSNELPTRLVSVICLDSGTQHTRRTPFFPHFLPHPHPPLIFSFYAPQLTKSNVMYLYMRTERHERQSRPESLQNTRGRTTTVSAFGCSRKSASTALLAVAWFDWPAPPVHLVERKGNGPSFTFRRLSFARLTESTRDMRNAHPSGFSRLGSNCNGPTEWHVV